MPIPLFPDFLEAFQIEQVLLFKWMHQKFVSLSFVLSVSENIGSERVLLPLYRF